MKKGCLISLSILIAGVAGYYYYFQGRFGPNADWGAAFGAGVFLTMVVGMFENFRLARGDAARVRASMKGAMPKDGELYAAVGSIAAIRAPLKSPFMEKDCVAYEYDVYQMVRNNNNNNGSTKRVYFNGHALTPSIIRAPFGNVKLLAWAMLDSFDKEFIEEPADITRGQNYLASLSDTQLTKIGIKNVISQAKELFSDDDGEMRKDYFMQERDDSVEGKTITEVVVAQGARVCAIGMYSTMKGGLIPSAGKTGYMIKLIPGEASEVASRLGKSSVWYFVGFVIMLAMLVGATIAVEKTIPRQSMPLSEASPAN